MIKPIEIEALVKQNEAAFKSVIESSCRNTGVFLGVLFCIAYTAFCLWWHFYYSDKKGYTDVQSIKYYLLYTCAGVGAYIMIIYVITLIIIYTPVRYLVAYAALNCLNLL